VRIIADENIPFVKDAFAAFGDVQVTPGRAITAAEVKTADILLVRSVTRVDEEMLTGSRVRFVGSATIGTDHIDGEALRQRGIAFAHAPGSNAESVVGYVLAAILRHVVMTGIQLSAVTVGVVGAGRIGSSLAKRLASLGTRVLVNDPPRANAEGGTGFVDLQTLLRQSDVVTLHVPLIRMGSYATVGLIGPDQLSLINLGALLINTSRGKVVDTAALVEATGTGRVSAVVDVWAEEPDIPRALSEAVDLMTPHIAGYSWDGKVRGTQMLHEALASHFGIVPEWVPPEVVIPARHLALPAPALPVEATLQHLVARMYDIEADDQRLREAATGDRPSRIEAFHGLRKEYPARYDFHNYRIDRQSLPGHLATMAAKGLGVTLV
jgi:erythronate-4-phosphate dehydrogenase